MTKTNFEAIARIIANRAEGIRAMAQETKADEHHDDGYMAALRSTTVDLAEYFEAENPRFDRQKFLTACGIM